MILAALWNELPQTMVEFLTSFARCSMEPMFCWRLDTENPITIEQTGKYSRLCWAVWLPPLLPLSLRLPSLHHQLMLV